MKAHLKRLKDCKVQMSVEVEAERAEDRYREVIRGFQRAARLPGFREGKAPVELIEQRFKDDARAEVLKSLIPEVYHQSIQAQKVSPVSLPKISDIRYERGKKLLFNAEFEESPKVSLKNYKGITLKREPSEVTNEELEKGIRSLLESRATFEPVLEVRPVRQGDFIVADIELWRDNAYAPGRNGVLLLVEPGNGDDFFEKVVGSNVDESREIVRQGKPYTRLRVRGIRSKQVPLLDDAFAKGLGKESVDEVRMAVRKELAGHKHAQSIENMKQQLFQKLLKPNAFSLPEGLVERQKERLLERAREHLAEGGAADLAEDVEARAKDQVKLYFILQKVAEQEKIEPDEVELSARLKGLSEQSGRPIEEVRRVFEDDLRDSLREKKTVDYLLANARFEE